MDLEPSGGIQGAEDALVVADEHEVGEARKE